MPAPDIRRLRNLNPLGVQLMGDRTRYAVGLEMPDIGVAPLR